MLQESYPELDDLLEMMGEAGKRPSEIEASEGAAGNISVRLRWQGDDVGGFENPGGQLSGGIAATGELSR